MDTDGWVVSEVDRGTARSSRHFKTEPGMCAYVYDKLVDTDADKVAPVRMRAAESRWAADRMNEREADAHKRWHDMGLE